jgi:hypothetical protein
MASVTIEFSILWLEQQALTLARLVLRSAVKQHQRTPTGLA